MRRRIFGVTLPEKPAFAAILLVSACTSNHRVSPWGGPQSPRLADFVERPDLAARIESVERETAALGLTRTVEIEGKFTGGRGIVRIRGYEGRDAARRPTHAVRAITPRAVVMAVGPLDAADHDRRPATELVPALVPGEQGGAYRSGTDLTGDGSPDVILRNEAGALEIWHLAELGAGRYQVLLEGPPTAAADVDEDGKIDLLGRAPIAPDDPLAPNLGDVATFDGERYSDLTPPARAWHARRAETPIPGSGGDELRLRAAVERAWHAILAGQPRDKALRALERESVPPKLRDAWARHVKRLEGVRR
jgi:hypothetical protein